MLFGPEQFHDEHQSSAGGPWNKKVPFSHDNFRHSHNIEKGLATTQKGEIAGNGCHGAQ